MEVKGTIIEIFETKQVTDKFKKREFVLKVVDNPEYPEYIKFEMIQNKCIDLDNNSVGQEVTIQLNIKGRKRTNPQGESQYFNTLQAWKIEGEKSSFQADNEHTAKTDELHTSEEPSDLPF